MAPCMQQSPLVTQNHGHVAVASIWVTTSTMEFIFHLLMMSTPHCRKLPSSAPIVSFQRRSSLLTLVTAAGHTGWIQLSERLLEKIWEPALLIVSGLDVRWGVVGGERGDAAVVLVKPFPAFTCLIPSPYVLTLKICDFHSICKNESSEF